MTSVSPRHTAVLAAVLFTLLLHNVHAISLSRYNKCPDLVRYFKNNAMSRVGAYGLSDQRNYGSFRPSFYCGPYRGRGFDPMPPVFLANTAFATDSANAAPTAFESNAVPKAAPSASEPVAGVDFSETNVQVEGVDEPDIIKTDGKRVFVVRGRKFFVLDVKDGGKNGRVTGELTLPSRAREMLIERDHLLVIAQTYGSIYPIPLSKRVGGIFFDQSTTSVYQIKVNNGIPKLVATLRMEGRYLNSREVDGVARIVMLYKPHLRFKYPSCVVPYAEAKAHNQEVIRRSTQNDWYPGYSLKFEGQSGETTSLISSCSNVYIPGIFPGFDLLTVVTLPVSGNLKPTGSVSIVSEGDEVYATASSLYVTTTEYRWDFFGFENSIRSGRDFKTSIHKFSLHDYGANYVASGEVSGSVLNQFSMHEYNRYFFIATTDGAPWWGARDESSSKVTSFRTNRYSKKLQKIGEVGNLGLGERIFAVRYVKDTAYVVTFRQIDPLYIIDLSRPWWLRVTGELKIPGFSSYLHPISAGRILGVGQDATAEGRVTGSKVTLFDVSDKTKPTELSSWTLPGSRSTAEWDHRAFLYWGPESVAVLPVSAYFASDRFVGSVVLEVSDSTIKERGRITHESVSSSRYSPSIERNLVLGGEHLWSLSSKQIQVNNIKDLSKESATTLS
ncbi:hypothetical protein BWQ96_04267 [Gracilariopsis chorda]|uniref:Beta propeller domain-containing protein n=1 Tax=Gracilariopsis chorda TaxID=448386 RepID=A0A2V3IV06_9FLOR|nr:hypothetical protein BWQ96_04267 [Gracilariopsis chorda]|eukprot:PXF45954.1 hypothetical protein BWQ96_04267 [Gracilariopsis chorda]